MKKNQKNLRKHLVIPIYEANLWIFVSADIPAERKKWEHTFGPSPTGQYDALCSWNGDQNFGLFFQKGKVTEKIIAHEVFHLTHRLLEWVSANFDPDHHEQGALLNTYLLEKVTGAVKKHVARN